ncbi:MAG TPA: energy transducer TonB [Terriglobia bacterium]|nr:energy transducer TonB [Terriglobia bacterium]
MPRSVAAQCSEEPTVLMDERTAESHLLSKKDLVLPADVPELARVRAVVLLVTVDREGTICAVKPVLGPKELQEAAVKTVKEHWRYRRFLLDWKPVVAQFPVTVRFMLPKNEPRLTAVQRARTRPSGQRKTV